MFKGWTYEPSKRFILGFTNKSVYRLRLPGSINIASSLHIVAQIRGASGSLTEFSLSSVKVFINFSELIDLSQEQLLQFLTNGEKNIDAQLILSIAHILNELTDDHVKAIAESKCFCRAHDLNEVLS